VGDLSEVWPASSRTFSCSGDLIRSETAAGSTSLMRAATCRIEVLRGNFRLGSAPARINVLTISAEFRGATKALNSGDSPRAFKVLALAPFSKK